MPIFKDRFNTAVTPLKNIHCSPVTLVVITTFAASLFVLSEWVFLFTRPSFLKTVPITEKLIALTTTSSLLVLAAMVAVVVLALPAIFLKPKTLRRVFTALALLIPTLLLTATLLLLVDNFTYTLFHFGIVSTRGAWRAIYAAIYVLLAIYLFIRLADLGNLLTIFFSRQSSRIRHLMPAALIVLAALGAILTANLSQWKGEALKQRTAASRNQMPDIVLITVDALNAEYTSIYGGERDTTPFLRELAATSLLGENHFANAQGTIGSLTSLLTGKHPADVRVIYSSDMLQASDAYQHLPGILNSSGYYTVQLSNGTYADAFKTNFQSAFDEANGRSATDQPFIHSLNTIYPGITAIFQNEMIERISARVLHIFYIRDMNNPYQEVTEAPQKFDDRDKIEKVKSLLNEKREPLFIHIHWMDTHGPNYYPDKQVFSEGLDIANQDADRQSFYYDSVLEFDQVVADLYQYLDENNRLDHTVLIVTSDHSQKWTNARLPLIFHFPGDMYKRTIASNTENIDIAPTLLDYLEIPQPAWMPGQSLITGSYNEHPIFTAKIPKSSKDSLTGKVMYPESEPPFFQFGRISVTVCDQWYELDLNELKLTSGQVAKYTTPCNAEINQRLALELIMGHLDTYGFDTLSLSLLLQHVETQDEP